MKPNTIDHVVRINVVDRHEWATGFELNDLSNFEIHAKSPPIIRP